MAEPGPAARTRVTRWSCATYLSGRLPPFKVLSYVTSGIVYPLGGEIHRWLADTYGDWRSPPCTRS